MRIRVDVSEVQTHTVTFMMQEVEQLDYVIYAEVDKNFDLVVKTIPDNAMHPAYFVSLGGLLSIFLMTTNMLGNEHKDKVEISFDDNTILNIFED